MKELLLQDFTPAGKMYTKIVSSSEDADVLAVQFEDFSEAQNGFHSKVSVQSGSIKVVFLQRWVDELINFVDPITKALNNSEAKSKVDELSAAFTGKAAIVGLCFPRPALLHCWRVCPFRPVLLLTSPANNLRHSRSPIHLEPASSCGLFFPKASKQTTWSKRF